MGQSPAEVAKGCASDGVLPVAGEMPAAKAPEPLIRSVRIVLSGVARTEQRFPCGKNLIAQMLCGSNSARMEKLRLNRLSTFGLLKHLTQPDVVSLMDGLVAMGHLEQSEIDPRRPVVRLTPSGIAVMKGTSELDGNLPVPADVLEKICGVRRPGRTSADGKPQSDPLTENGDPAMQAGEPFAELSASEQSLLAVLRKWRRARADASGLPTFMILSNNTLTDLARRRPNSPESLAEVKGIGKAKIQQYGEELLKLLQHPGADVRSPGFSRNPGEEPPKGGTTNTALVAADSKPSPPLPGDAAVQPSHYWTWRLLSCGFTAEESAAIRGIRREVLLDHALRAIEEGWPFRAEWCLSPELLAALEKIAGSEPYPPIRTLLPRLPPGTRFEEVDLFVKCHRKFPSTSGGAGP